MIRSVSTENGTSGREKKGSESGRAPMSPTVGTSTPRARPPKPMTAMATRGAGTTLVMRGSPTMMAIPSATITYTEVLMFQKCSIWARKMRMASELTNPIMTVRGTKRISRPNPRTPKVIWMIPASTVAANR